MLSYFRNTRPQYIVSLELIPKIYKHLVCSIYYGGDLCSWQRLTNFKRNFTKNPFSLNMIYAPPGYYHTFPILMKTEPPAVRIINVKALSFRINFRIYARHARSFPNVKSIAVFEPRKLK